MGRRGHSAPGLCRRSHRRSRCQRQSGLRLADSHHLASRTAMVTFSSFSWSINRTGSAGRSTTTITRGGRQAVVWAGWGCVAAGEEPPRHALGATCSRLPARRVGHRAVGPDPPARPPDATAAAFEKLAPIVARPAPCRHPQRSTGWASTAATLVPQLVGCPAKEAYAGADPAHQAPGFQTLQSSPTPLCHPPCLPVTVMGPPSGAPKASQGLKRRGMIMSSG